MGIFTDIIEAIRDAIDSDPDYRRQKERQRQRKALKQQQKTREEFEIIKPDQDFINDIQNGD